MIKQFPNDPREYLLWNWVQIKPFADDLIARPLTPDTMAGWVSDWSDLNRLITEMQGRLWVATTIDTTDLESKNRYNSFLDEVFDPFQASNQVLKEKLLASGLQPEGFEIALRNMKVEAEIYCEANLALLSQEKKLANEYDEVVGVQTVEWEGKEVTPQQLAPVYLSQDRARRERAWRLVMQRKLADRQKINDLWKELLNVRIQIGKNGGFKDYRAYRWKELLRFDYTAEDCYQFHQAIERVVVPAAFRIYEKRRKSLGLSSLRPWDLDVDPMGREALKPFETIEELERKVSVIFHRIDPVLGEYFETMRREGLLDLDNRKGKAPGAYCNNYDLSRRPFIFENAVGIHSDVSTLIHEGGHAFHVFEEANLPYYHQLPVGMEIAEVASTAMEMLAFPFLRASEGGFYNEKDAARAQIEFLEEAVLFLPYMVVVDAFQHWAYENQEAARSPLNCDQKWTELWRRYMVGVDWGGLENEMVTGWQRKQHIFEVAFYYIEYGLASLGAFQVWENSLKDTKAAVVAYRRALALGGTKSIPELYEAAGAKFAFDAKTVLKLVNLAEETIEKLEQV